MSLFFQKFLGIYTNIMKNVPILRKIPKNEYDPWLRVSRLEWHIPVQTKSEHPPPPDSNIVCADYFLYQLFC